MNNPYPAPLDQAWLGLWVGLFGRDSMLTRYLNGGGSVHQPQAPARTRRRALEDQAGVPPRRHPRPPPLEKKTPSKLVRAERRLERDIDRVTQMPMSDWAKRIVNDPRVAEITLQDILDGIEDYFEIFDRMRRVHPQAHAYFSRVGAPIILSSTVVHSSALDALTVANPAGLPSYFGAFFTTTKEKHRQQVFDDKWVLNEFHLFEKPKNYATVASAGTVIFTHSTIWLKRDYFSREELKKYPSERYSDGMWWYIGVQPDGQVRALPHRLQRNQKLPGGEYVHHSSFEVPPGLYELGEGDPHKFARAWFNIAVAFTASAAAGIQVTIKRGRKSARFGVPIGALRGFFADRDAEGRRKPIIHFRPGHDRHMRDGRIIPIGEHLSGERFFSWRGYDVTVGVPGIHYPAPEGFDGAIYIDGDAETPLPADAPKELIPLKQVADVMQSVIWRRHRVPIRHGVPTKQYVESKLPPNNWDQP